MPVGIGEDIPQAEIVRGGCNEDAVRVVPVYQRFRDGGQPERRVVAGVIEPDAVGALRLKNRNVFESNGRIFGKVDDVARDGLIRLVSVDPEVRDRNARATAAMQHTVAAAREGEPADLRQLRAVADERRAARYRNVVDGQDRACGHSAHSVLSHRKCQAAQQGCDIVGDPVAGSAEDLHARRTPSEVGEPAFTVGRFNLGSQIAVSAVQGTSGTTRYVSRATPISRRMEAQPDHGRILR